MRRALIAAVLAGCGTQAAPGMIGEGSVNHTSLGAWTYPEALVLTPPGMGFEYVGWNVALSTDAPGTPCSAVSSSVQWTAMISLQSASTGSTPDDASIAPGTFDIGTSQTVVVVAEDSASTGQVVITAFDDEHIAGTFSAMGPGFAITGEFDAPRCLVR